MAYSVEANIQAEFKNLPISSTTNISSADVASFITQADALINSYVSKRYTAPVTSGEGLELLKMLSIAIVAERIRGILQVKKSPASDADQSVRRMMSMKEIIKMLEDIASGDVALIGAELNQSGGGLYSENVATHVEPYFKKDRKQW